MVKNNYGNLDFSKGTQWGAFTSLGEIKKEGTCYMIYCQCECGHKQRVRRQELVKKTRSCFNCASKKKANPTHGMTGTRLYSIRHAMQQRLNNSNNSNYKNYGGRGIICERKSFEEFYKDMSESYYDHIKKYGTYKGTTLERINNDGNYCKENCRRATIAEQNANKQACWINRYGITQEDFAKKYGCTKGNVIIRFKRCGYDFNKLVEYMESDKRPQHYKGKTARGWSIELGLRPGKINEYIKHNNCSLEEAVKHFKK